MQSVFAVFLKNMRNFFIKVLLNVQHERAGSSEKLAAMGGNVISTTAEAIPIIKSAMISSIKVKAFLFGFTVCTPLGAQYFSELLYMFYSPDFPAFRTDFNSMRMRGRFC